MHSPAQPARAQQAIYLRTVRSLRQQLSIFSSAAAMPMRSPQYALLLWHSAAVPACLPPAGALTSSPSCFFMCCIAVSALYYLLTGYGPSMLGTEAGEQAILLAGDALLVALQVGTFWGDLMKLYCNGRERPPPLQGRSVLAGVWHNRCVRGLTAAAWHRLEQANLASS